MSVKVLVDCVLTASPSKCSTAVIFKTAIERLLAQREDVFVYWLIPDWLTEEERLFFPQSDRVKYMPTVQTKDRVREYLTLPPALYDALTFYGPCWDFDILLTMRTGLIPQMRLLMNGPRNIKTWWTKEVWLLEVMPAMKFKQTVPQMVPDVHDRFTLEGYLAADRVWVGSYFEPKGIMLEARKHLTPSQANSIAAKMKPMITGQFETFQFKPDEYRYRPGERPFVLSYIGRMEKANGIEDIATILENAWVMRGDSVKQVVCTVSKIVKTFDEDLVDVRFPKREEFWKIVTEEMDAFVYMGKSGATSLSVLEPLMLGTPVITVRDEAKVALLGPDYPFYASGPSTIYGVFKALYDDYPAQYAKFEKWHTEWFQPVWKKRFEDDLIYPQIVDAVAAYEAKLEARKGELQTLDQNQMVLDLLEHHKDGETIYETVLRAGSKVFGVMCKKADPKDHKSRNLTFMSAWNSYRLGLKLFHGFSDTSVELGHLNKAN